MILMVVMCMFVSGMTIVSAEEGNNITIKFTVGDSTLLINGTPMEVETPYVTDGTTLVPIRVITEAFGAELTWIGETREIELSYLDVMLKLQIDNKDVYVNSQKQSLLLAPELKDSTTMVPLRFITENFGAEVKYDEQTKEISIIKEVTGTDPLNEVSDILKKSDKAYVGDSYYKWSLKRTADMELSYRSFDGRHMDFSFEDDAELCYQIFNNSENKSLEVVRTKEIEGAKGYTLTDNKILKTKNGTQYISLKFKNKENNFDRKIYVYDDKITILFLITDVNLDAKAMEKYNEIISSFDLSINSSETQDLSEVENGMRLFSEKDLNIEFRMPADWLDFSNDNKLNSFDFRGFGKDDKIAGSISLNIYSREDETIEEWAARDLARNKRQINPALYVHSDLKTMQVGGKTATYYSCDSESHGIKYVGNDIFWEAGDYGYNLHIEALKNNEALIKKIVDSVKFEEIDASEVGILLMEKLEEDEDSIVTTVKNTSLKFELDVPAKWAQNPEKTSFYDSAKGLGISIMKADKTVTIQEINEVYSSILKKDEAESVRKVTPVPKTNLSNNSYTSHDFEVLIELNGNKEYVTQCVITSGKNSYILTFSIPEMFYSEINKETIAKIIKSFKIQ